MEEEGSKGRPWQKTGSRESSEVFSTGQLDHAATCSTGSTQFSGISIMRAGGVSMPLRGRTGLLVDATVALSLIVCVYCSHLHTQISIRALVRFSLSASLNVP